jgi:hypothetical protein
VIVAGHREPPRSLDTVHHRTAIANLLQATWNFERQQGIGWAFALLPALKRLYPSREQRLERLAEHTAYFNTQPTTRLDRARRGRARRRGARDGMGVDADGMVRLKSVLGSTLARWGTGCSGSRCGRSRRRSAC